MKAIRIYLFAAFLLMGSISVFSQITSVSEVAKENFAKQYPSAQDIKWSNDVVNANVRFELNGQKMNAEYSNKGIWKSTEQDASYDSLPATVKDGFGKSKFAGREVEDAKIIYLPGNVVQYRLKVAKNDVQKNFLFFNEKGRLLRDSITI